MNILNDLNELKKRPPVWFMRQAGRYLPEYRKVREEYTFLDLCCNPKKAAEVSKQPLDILNVDMLVIFSDILLPLRDLGYDIIFPNTGGIKVHSPNTLNTITSIGNNMQATCNAIQELQILIGQDSKITRQIPIIGFAGAPWTLASYILQQGSTKGEMTAIQQFALNKPQELHDLLQYLTDMMSIYLKEQVDAGASIIQLFDTWAGECSQDIFAEFVRPYQQQLLQQLPDTALKSVYMKNITPYIHQVADIGADILSIDWKISLSQAWQILDNTPNNTIQYLQGNLNPLYLTSDNQEAIKSATLKILKEADTLPCKHIMNLGHGITPEAHVESARTFVNTAKDFLYTNAK